MLANKRKHSPVVFQTLLRIRKHFLKKCRKNSRECGHFENLLGCKYIQDKKMFARKMRYLADAKTFSLSARIPRITG